MSIWNGNRTVLSFILHKSIFVHFVYHGTRFYDKYIASDYRKKYMDDVGRSIFPRQNVIKLYNAKYQNNYSNQYFFLKMTL